MTSLRDSSSRLLWRSAASFIRGEILVDSIASVSGMVSLGNV